MKLIRLATVATLSTVILAGGFKNVSAQEVRDVTTDGQVEFRPAGEDDDPLEVINPEKDPESPDVDINPEMPGTTGPLSIVKAAWMDFGTQVISNQDQVYNMVAEMQQLTGTEGDENKVPYVSFAQVQDLRGTNEGWNLKVSLDDFTSNTQNNVLTGAEIALLSPRIQYEGVNTENAPIAHSDGLRLIPGVGSVSVMRAPEGHGAGASSVVWGNQADLNAQFIDDEVEIVTNNAIKLSVPGSTAKDATTYTSTLTWELSATPGDDA